MDGECARMGYYMVKELNGGGDIHVLHGDIHQAESVGIKTREAGLETAAYGSYYHFDSDVLAFDDLVDTAITLKAPLMRAWAGKLGSADCSTDYYNRIVKEIQKGGDLCKKAGIKLALEYHNGTITDTNESALKLMKDIDHPSVYSY